MVATTLKRQDAELLSSRVAGHQAFSRPESKAAPVLGYAALRSDDVECQRVVLLGGLGVIGKMHARIYRDLGIPFTPIDPMGGGDWRRTLDQVDWSGTVVDICTPTATHGDCLEQMYARGARLFIVEKPAAICAASWRAQVSAMPDARIFVVHNYLFSQAFRLCREMMVEPIEISTIFNKDRLVDDENGRGACPAGRLAHVLHIEAPHQFAMALALAPDLEVLGSDHFAFGGRSAHHPTPVAASVMLRNKAGKYATLRTHLRKPLQRTLRVTEWDGRIIEVRFPTYQQPRSVVLDHAVDGRTTKVFDGRDDMLSTTLRSALKCLRHGEIPWEASASFAESVLERIDQSLLAAAAASMPGWMAPRPVRHDCERTS